MDEGIAIIAAAVLALSGIYISGYQQRRLLRRQHTHRVLEKMNDWPEFEQKWLSARQLIDSRTRLDVENPAQDDTREQIDFLLNHYEFIAASIVSGDLDETLIRRVEETRMSRIYLRFLDYVTATRRDIGRNSTWEHLEFMCHRWRAGGRDPIDRLLDLILGRPVLGAFQIQRTAIHDVLSGIAATLR